MNQDNIPCKWNDNVLINNNIPNKKLIQKLNFIYVQMYLWSLFISFLDLQWDMTIDSSAIDYFVSSEWKHY